ncbi:MAG: hypothetical protein MK179_01595 [Pirellulaceae bacterium]|nr:hypothetical protein [Pirellulaceae bacterium]
MRHRCLHRVRQLSNKITWTCAYKLNYVSERTSATVSNAFKVSGSRIADLPVACSAFRADIMRTNSNGKRLLNDLAVLDYPSVSTGYEMLQVPV